MKNILRYALTICAAGCLAGSCTSNFDEYNTNQNQMEMGDVHPLNLLEHILFTGADGLVYRTWLLNNELVQYTVQMYTENVHRYMIRDSYNSGTWNHLARWAANSDHMIEQAVKNEDANSEAIALTMRALFVSNWTDIYGDIPFSEAFQGRNNVLKPKFDTQQEVYTQLFRRPRTRQLALRHVAGAALPEQGPDVRRATSPSGASSPTRSTCGC